MVAEIKVPLTQSAKEAVLYANTPQFLLDRLRKDPSVRWLVEKFDGREIVALFEAQGRAASPEDLTRKYVLLASLLSCDWSERWASLRKLDLRDLEWATAIINLAHSEEVPTYTENISIAREAGQANAFSWNQATIVNR